MRRVKKRTGDGKRARAAATADHPPIFAGVYAALTAEAVFMASVSTIASLRGGDPWKVVKVPASFVIGPEATRPEGFVPGDVLLGLLMHLLFAALVGILYARLLGPLRLSPRAGGLLTGGLLYGFGFWLLPELFPQGLEPFRLPLAGKALQALAHLMYGVVLGVVFARLSCWPRAGRRRNYEACQISDRIPRSPEHQRTQRRTSERRDGR